MDCRKGSVAHGRPSTLTEGRGSQTDEESHSEPKRDNNITNITPELYPTSWLHVCFLGVGALLLPTCYALGSSSHSEIVHASRTPLAHHPHTTATLAKCSEHRRLGASCSPLGAMMAGPC
eukprot:2262587-Pyramimonas_sp.AAC.1